MRLTTKLFLTFLTIALCYISASFIISKEQQDQFDLLNSIRNMEILENFEEIIRNMTDKLKIYVNMSIGMIKPLTHKIFSFENKSPQLEDQVALKSLKTRFNFASLNGGAKILSSNPGSISAKSILDDKKDT